MNKKHYTTPRTECISIELETAFMNKASVFEPEDGHDDGVTIEGHEIGNEGDYFDNGNGTWD